MLLEREQYRLTVRAPAKALNISHDEAHEIIKASILAHIASKLDAYMFPNL
jgi:hypothetical protein